jgi:hypothetical protein
MMLAFKYFFFFVAFDIHTSYWQLAFLIGSSWLIEQEISHVVDLGDGWKQFPIPQQAHFPSLALPFPIRSPLSPTLRKRENGFNSRLHTAAVSRCGATLLLHCRKEYPSEFRKQ